MKNMISMERIENRIYLIRGQKVMLDRDLAELYEVKTKVLNQAVRRNKSRFPVDFMFQLTQSEKEELVTICDRLSPLKHSTALPYAFTEQGVAMLSSVLNSEKAVLVNIAIMRTFVKLKQMVLDNREFAQKLDELERRVVRQDVRIETVFDAIRKIMAPEIKPQKRIGFLADREEDD